MTATKKQTLAEARKEIERLAAELVDVAKQRDRLKAQVLEARKRADTSRAIRSLMDHGGLWVILTPHDDTLAQLEKRVAKIGREAAEAELTAAFQKALAERDQVDAAEHLERWADAGGLW